MATIQDSISLRDGVSGTLSRIVGGFDNVARVAGFTSERLNEVERPRVISAVAGGFNTTMQVASNQVTNLAGRIKDLGNTTIAKFAAGDIIANSIMKIFGLINQIPDRLLAASDEYSGIQSRINLVTNDAAGMNERIYQSALRARGSYAGMADAVSKIGMTAKEAFPDANLVVPFMENVQKLFAIGGTDAVRQKDALLQLTQALGSGKLQGDEFRSIAEAAPMIEQMVARYMGVTQGELKKLSTEGKITAEVMKNAILGATDEINAKFDTIPLKWQDISQNIRTVATKAFVPAFSQISAIANSPTMKAIGENIGIGLQVAGIAVAGLINNLQWLGGIVMEVGGYVSSWLVAGFTILGEVASAVLPYAMGMLIAYSAGWLALNSQMLINAGIGAIVYGWTMLVAGAQRVWAGVTFLLSGAQAVLNAVLSLNPIPLIIMLVMAVIGAFAGWMIATKGLRGTIASAFGSIAETAGIAINFMIRRTNDLIGILNKAAVLINNVFGTSIGMVGTVDEVDAKSWGKKTSDFITNFDINNIGKMLGLGGLGGLGAGSSSSNFGVGGYEPGTEKVKPVHVRGGKLDKDQEIQLSEENLKTLTDLAQREVQLHYQQITPQFQISFGDVRETANVDEIMERIGDHITNIYEGNLGTS